MLNWILLIALVVALAHVEQPMTSFTNDVLVFTNATCARMVSSWETTISHAKQLDAQLLAWERMIADMVIEYVQAVSPHRGFVRAWNLWAENFRPSRWLPPHLYADLMKHACGA